MKRIATIFCLTIIAAIGVAAQDNAKPAAPKVEAKPAAAAPSVDEILDRYVKALGGKEAIEKISSRTAKGAIEIEAVNLSGPFEMYSKAPNKSAMTINLSGFGVINQVFDGAKGYAADPMTGLRELGGVELAATKRDAEFYRDLNLKKQYSKMEVKGVEKVGNSSAFVVEATPAEGSPEKFFFDVESGLLLRQDSEREGPQGKMAIENYLEDYKVVDGVKIPFVIRQVSPLFSMSMKIAEVKHNVEIEETKFAKPSGN